MIPFVVVRLTQLHFLSFKLFFTYLMDTYLVLCYTNSLTDVTSLLDCFHIRSLRSAHLEAGPQEIPSLS